MLNPEKIYCEFGKHLLDEEDLDFSSSFIQILNTILLTSKELAELRQKIRKVISNFDFYFFDQSFDRKNNSLNFCLNLGVIIQFQHYLYVY